MMWPLMARQPKRSGYEILCLGAHTGDKDASAIGAKPRERRLDSRRGRVSYFTWDGPGGPGG